MLTVIHINVFTIALVSLRDTFHSDEATVVLATCIGYTLGSQCIPGIYPRWFLIRHEGVISKPPRVFPIIHGYLRHKQVVG